jgi:hypothetical protein
MFDATSTFNTTHGGTEGTGMQKGVYLGASVPRCVVINQPQLHSC